MVGVLERAVGICGEQDPEDAYSLFLALFHEDMHDEAFTYTRQTLGYSPPRLPAAAEHTPPGDESQGALPGDVSTLGGPFALGASPSEPFVFDNEKWSHPVTIGRSTSPVPPSRGSSSRPSLTMTAIVARNSGAQGWRWRGKRRLSPRLLAAAAGRRLGRRDIDRWVPWSRDDRCCTCACTRPMPIAGGPAADYPAKTSGKPQRPSCTLPTGVADPGTKRGSRGVMIRPLRPTPTSIPRPWVRDLRPLPLVTAPSVAAR